jgi:two-component system CheB/CheR fusion protein
MSSKNKTPTAKFPIVGLGGSAGSLSAFENFFINTPLNSGIAFVIVQHLDPDKKSLLTDIIGRNTKMPVVLVVRDTTVKPDHIYVIPPNKEMIIDQGVLKLRQFSPGQLPKYPIDTFLISLSEYNKQYAAAILFSGMGSDGTEGIKAVKANRGLTLVQKPSTAAFDSMPLSAINTGLVDYILPVEDLPGKFMNWAESYNQHPSVEISLKEEQLQELMQKVCNMILRETGNDFSQYKLNTVSRRIESRMNSLRIRNLIKYVAYLEDNAEEIIILFRELLIGVTNFFRDEDSFEVLKTKVIPPILRNKAKGETIRIWSCACSTGDEAYSLAILIHEVLEEISDPRLYKVQIFGTDLDDESIHQARTGLFNNNIAKYISEDRLQKYFKLKGNQYQINKEIREMVVFAIHNVIKDPPFTKLDILSCRNLLIYLTPELQKKILYTFRYALNPTGILFLGSSETLGGFGEMFFPIDAKWRIFAKRESASTYFLRNEYNTNVVVPKPVEKKEVIKYVPDVMKEVASMVQKELLANFAPPSVVINKNGDIIFVNGETGKYLRLAQGQASLNILDMACESIHYDLSNAIREVNSEKSIVVKTNLMVKTDMGYESLNIKVSTFSEVKDTGLLLVIFEDTTVANTKDMVMTSDRREAEISTITELQHEITYTKKHLQNTIEEMEITMEELTSANEESQSTNEELQSANEELTTSKEEMQSLNEELISLNAELQSKMGDFSQVNNDMKNLLLNSETAVIFLDNDLCVKRFSTGAAKIIRLITTDIGRPFSDIVTNIKAVNLEKNIREVLEYLTYKEMEVETNDYQWYKIKIAPYRTVENFIEGAIIIFANISETKKLNDKLFIAYKSNSKIMESMRDAVVLLNEDFRIVTVNSAFCRILNENPGNIIDKLFFEIYEGFWDVPQFKDMLQGVFEIKKEFNDFEVITSRKLQASQKLLINGRIIYGNKPEPQMLLLVMENITHKSEY